MLENLFENIQFNKLKSNYTTFKATKGFELFSDKKFVNFEKLKQYLYKLFNLEYTTPETFSIWTKEIMIMVKKSGYIW